MQSAVRRFRIGAWPLAALIATLALAACSSSTPGVLAQSDIPSYLGVTQIAAGQVNYLAPRHCGPESVALFTPPGKDPEPKPIGPGVIRYIQVVSLAVHCDNILDARKALQGQGQVERLTGLGDQSILIGLIDRQGASGREYAVEWRRVSTVDFVGVEGSDGDKRITPALAELLARRAAART